MVSDLISVDPDEKELELVEIQILPRLWNITLSRSGDFNNGSRRKRLITRLQTLCGRKPLNATSSQEWFCNNPTWEGLWQSGITSKSSLTMKKLLGYVWRTSENPWNAYNMWQAEVFENFCNSEGKLSKIDRWPPSTFVERLLPIRQQWKHTNSWSRFAQQWSSQLCYVGSVGCIGTTREVSFSRHGQNGCLHGFQVAFKVDETDKMGLRQFILITSQDMSINEPVPRWGFRKHNSQAKQM